MKEVTGDIWQDNTVNVICVLTNGTVQPDGRNIMGGGIALEAARHALTKHDADLPWIYGQSLQKYGLSLRHLFTCYGDHRPLDLLAFPTKYEISDKASLDLIETSMIELITYSTIFPEKMIGLPRPGSGLGGLSWENDVKTLMRLMLDGEPFEDRIVIYSK